MSLTFVTARLRRPILVAIAIYLASASCRFSALAEALPDMRPALVGSGKEALINLIDTQKMVKDGQGDAALMFVCLLSQKGHPDFFSVYRVPPGAEKLKDEVRRCLYKAHFIPAVYNHETVRAKMFGTVMFRVADGKPRLRIFANQEMSELEKESDFIGPQPIAIPGHHYERIEYPRGPWASEDRPGIVPLTLSIDASGQLKDVQIISETPPGHNFGTLATKVIRQSTYLPAFRNGKPVDCTVHINFILSPRGWHWK